MKYRTENKTNLPGDLMVAIPEEPENVKHGQGGLQSRKLISRQGLKEDARLDPAHLKDLNDFAENDPSISESHLADHGKKD